MRRSGQQQQVWGRFRQQPGEFVPSHVFSVARDSVGLIDDHEVPSGGRKVGGPGDVVALDPVRTPPSAGLDRLDGVQRNDQPIVGKPEVVFPPTRQRADLGRRERDVLLAEPVQELRLATGRRGLSARRRGRV